MVNRAVQAGKKAQQWVVYRENTVLTFNDPDDQTPTSTMDGVDGAKFEVKAKKGDSFSIKLTKGKQKLSLICENDLLCQKWQDVLKQGKSGSTAGRAATGGGGGGGAAESRGPVLKLKAFIPVEDIEEYTEEDEMRDEGRSVTATPVLCYAAASLVVLCFTDTPASAACVRCRLPSLPTGPRCSKKPAEHCAYLPLQASLET